MSTTRDALHRQIDELPDERLAVIESSPDVMSGTPVFRGTRVPARTLLDYLAAGHSTQQFLDDFPSVNPQQVLAVLELTRSLVPR